MPANDKARFEAVAAKDKQRYYAECKERGYTPIHFKKDPPPSTVADTTSYGRGSDSDMFTNLFFHVIVPFIKAHSSDEHPTQNNTDRDPSVVSVYSDASGEGEVSNYASSHEENCHEGTAPLYNYPTHTYNHNAPLSDIFMIGLHNEFNAELTAMEDAILELQRGCDVLEASSNAERQAYFKVKVLLGEKRRRREAAPNLL